MTLKNLIDNLSMKKVFTTQRLMFDCIGGGHFQFLQGRRVRLVEPVAQDVRATGCGGQYRFDTDQYRSCQPPRDRFGLARKRAI